MPKSKYDCCTHYREKGDMKGYIVLPCFKVKVCKNCGEVQALWGEITDIFFKFIFQWFWTGIVHITEE